MKKVHEVHATIPGKEARMPLYTDKIYLHHWQIQSENRANYLPKLEYALLETENDDRNTYYTAREYMYQNQFDTSLMMFEKYLLLGGWPPERGQAYIFMGDCYKFKGDVPKAVEHYHKAIATDDTRREGFFALGSLYNEKQQYRSAAIYLRAALEIPYNPNYYLNHKDLYTWKLHDLLALVYNKLGKDDKGKEQWLLALKNAPNDKRILSNFLWYYKDDQPLISIIVPTMRPEGYERLIKSIKENTVYKNYEIIKKDGTGSAIKKFNEGVNECKGEFVIFLADDTEIKLGCIENAFIKFRETFGKSKGLVILNDEHWNGTIANHFLCSKNIREELDGEIWHGGYFHCGADDELAFRLKQKNLITFCEEAKIIHHHYFSPSKGIEKSSFDEGYAIMESHMEEDRQLCKKRLASFK